VESSILGLSGTMMVEDGTKCAPDSACYSGECISKADAIKQIVSGSHHSSVRFCSTCLRVQATGECRSYQDCLFTGESVFFCPTLHQ